MSSYPKCPSCGNRNKGHAIHKCRECGKTFCQKCGADRFGDLCPKCAKAAPKVGHIVG